MASDATLGMCLTLLSNYNLIVRFTGYQEETGDIQESPTILVLNLDSFNKVHVSVNEYTTNNIFFGHLANILSYTLVYYDPYDYTESALLTATDTVNTCFDWGTGQGYSCTLLSFQASGTVNYYTQLFDDVTAPILFFVSLIETLFFLIYAFCLKNYNNNALYLRIADSVVYLEDSHHRHYNFKNGAAVFIACLLHNNFIVKALDWAMYRTCETEVKKMLSLKAQLTIKMIDFGQKCLGEEMVFDRINAIYEQENLQPMKIIFEEE
jgi:hypothetical protein